MGDVMKRIAGVVALTLASLGLLASPVSAAPRACTRALDRAEVVMDYAVQGFTLTAEAFAAAADLDTDEMDRINDEIIALAPQVRSARNAYDRAARACRAS